MRCECLFFLLIYSLRIDSKSDYQWSYDQDFFNGPQYWGRVVKEWWMCERGQIQSPIDIQPKQLLFDSSIKPIKLDKVQVVSEMVNVGQMIRVRIGYSRARPSVNITNGPLNGYQYRVQRIDFHFGNTTHNGSEHTINGRRYPMEVQLVAFNTDIYPNFTTASKSPHGIAILSILVDFGEETNMELLKMTIATASVTYKDKRVQLAEFEPWRLLPMTRDLITYEGSLTTPGCDETVTWILLNQPIYITKDHFFEWSKLYFSQESQIKAPIGPNYRATQKTNNRLVRTNIQHKTNHNCKLSVGRVFYRANQYSMRKN
ncbi:unnamed protein product [Caenorhabditis angaria]|uniref:Alpha-carbonic anhydrase domain-containing protein n=1 Tax=Caenorhabditis angaria TaxID=860376 RepID=A0A9P1IJP6_9PELO|nr:unnamed protein product [Caenorhabditis angaria]